MLQILSGQMVGKTIVTVIIANLIETRLTEMGEKKERKE